MPRVKILRNVDAGLSLASLDVYLVTCLQGLAQRDKVDSMDIVSRSPTFAFRTDTDSHMKSAVFTLPGVERGVTMQLEGDYIPVLYVLVNVDLDVAELGLETLAVAGSAWHLDQLAVTLARVASRLLVKQRVFFNPGAFTTVAVRSISPWLGFGPIAGRTEDIFLNFDNLLGRLKTLRKR